MTKEDLVKFGFTTGNAVKFLKAFAGAVAAPHSGGAAAAAAAGGGGAAAAAASGISSLSLTAPLRNHLQPLLHTEYRGVIAIVAGHVPSLSCGQCMLQHLATVLPEVVRMDFIVQECERKLESLHALTLPADMAFAIVAYTYDLGLSSATDDGRCHVASAACVASFVSPPSPAITFSLP